MKKNGFTLIELIVCVAIVAVLIALVIGGIGGYSSMIANKDGVRTRQAVPGAWGTFIITDPETGAQYIEDSNGNLQPRWDKDGKQIFVK